MATPGRGYMCNFERHTAGHRFLRPEMSFSSLHDDGMTIQTQARGSPLPKRKQSRSRPRCRIRTEYLRCSKAPPP